MAIRLEDEYGALATPADTNYPGGSFLNDPTGTGTAGTPLEKTWADDLLGARDAVLQAAGVGYSGAPDTAGASDFLDALYNLFVKIDDAVSAATANKVVRRDANGRFKAAAPSASDDVALKSTVDTAVALRALLAGSSGQQFSVAAGTNTAHAVNRGQLASGLNSSGVSYQKMPAMAVETGYIPIPVVDDFGVTFVDASGNVTVAGFRTKTVNLSHITNPVFGMMVPISACAEGTANDTIFCVVKEIGTGYIKFRMSELTSATQNVTGFRYFVFGGA